MCLVLDAFKQRQLLGQFDLNVSEETKGGNRCYRITSKSLSIKIINNY